MKNFLLMLSAAVILAGCGSDNDNSAPVTSSGTTGDNTMPAVADAFTDRVAAIVASSPDNTEAEPIDALTVSTPNETQAQPII